MSVPKTKNANLISCKSRYGRRNVHRLCDGSRENYQGPEDLSGPARALYSFIRTVSGKGHSGPLTSHSLLLSRQPRQTLAVQLYS